MDAMKQDLAHQAVVAGQRLCVCIQCLMYVCSLAGSTDYSTVSPEYIDIRWGREIWRIHCLFGTTKSITTFYRFSLDSADQNLSAVFHATVRFHRALRDDVRRLHLHSAASEYFSSIRYPWASQAGQLEVSCAKSLRGCSRTTSIWTEASL